MGGGSHLVTVLNLGMQALTGVFPRTCDEAIGEGPLELVWSPDSGLLQLRHSFQPSEMYGDNYGYRSGLNQSMIDHLTHKVRQLQRMAPLQSGDAVLDIGSNDGTLLKSYETNGVERIGIDPTGTKFSLYYPADIKLVPEFFSSAAYRGVTQRPAKIVTSIAMFYDLDRPMKFAREVESVLADDGIWHFEQSYMPSMLRLNSYDTICHEHLEYYSLQAVERDPFRSRYEDRRRRHEQRQRRQLRSHGCQVRQPHGACQSPRHRLDAGPGRAHGPGHAQTFS